HCVVLDRLPCHLIPHTPTTMIHTLSLHDALPICPSSEQSSALGCFIAGLFVGLGRSGAGRASILWLFNLFRRSAESAAHHVEGRSEEHTSELQSRENLVCRLLLEKKKYLHHSPLS